HDPPAPTIATLSLHDALPISNASNTPYRKYKSWTEEGGIITPFVAHWPKGIRQPGMFTDDVGHIVDIMATCVAVAGAPYPNLYQDRKSTRLNSSHVKISYAVF